MTETCNTFCSNDQRRTILLLEALALIHDIGKLTDRFLESEAPKSKISHNTLFIDPSQLELYNNLSNNKKKSAIINKRLDINGKKYQAFSERPDLTGSLKSIKITDWNNTSYTLADLVPFLSKTTFWKENDWNDLLGKNMQPGLLIGYMHGIAHFDKEDNTKAKQTYNEVYRATPFGFEEKIQTGDNKELTDILLRLPLTAENINKINTVDRQDWLDAMRCGMSKGIADNRRPINDVTLWDWGYLVASLTKASANYIFKTGWPKSLEDLPFLTLRINLDKLELYAGSDKISDLLGKQEVMNDSFASVRKLVEYELALGNRIYHDETGDYFLLPGHLSDDVQLLLKKSIQQKFPEDLQPRVHFGKPVTAGYLDIIKHKKNKASVIKAIRQLIADPREMALRESPVHADNNLYLFTNEWSRERPNNTEICSVCGLQPVGSPIEGTNPEKEEKLNGWAGQKKAEERHVCRICLNRRDRRAQKWAQEIQKKSIIPTIWTDEVADDQGLLALFVGSFGLTHWLDGSALVTTRLSNPTAKNPSPARLYRITETVRSFWKSMNESLLQKETTLENEQNLNNYRLCLVPENQGKLDLGAFHTYELECQGITLSVVWDNEREHFLSIENLHALANRNGIKGGNLSTILKLNTHFNKDKSATLRIPSSDGKAGFKKTDVMFCVVGLSTTAHYLPVIPLLTEPGLCMNLLPADKALDFAFDVHNAYQNQMNRVQDRLPLGIGLVFFPRRTPIRAVMEAGSSMLNMLNHKPETWTVKECITSDSSYKLTCTNDISITYQAEYKTIREKEDNCWYLWCFDDRENETHQVTPIKNLRTHNKIRVYPSRFDFEFLDTAGRRYEICYDEKGKRNSTKPFYSADFEELEKLWCNHFQYLSLSQRYQIIGLVEDKREEWEISASSSEERRKTFRQFVSDTLIGANWPKGKKWDTIDEKSRTNLIDAGVSGQLKDLFELHLQILKEKNGGSE